MAATLILIFFAALPAIATCLKMPWREALVAIVFSGDAALAYLLLHLLGL
jgi:hypothetical protein